MRTTRRARSAISLARLLRRGRELPALALASLWLFGVVVAPLAHMALHDVLAPHSHGVLAADAEASLETHCHEGHCHGDPGHGDAAASPPSSKNERPAEHGRGSSLHGHLAALFPAPAFVIPPFVAVGERAQPAPLVDVIEAPPAPSASARGPPPA